MAVILLRNIVDALDSLMEGTDAYLDVETGEIVTLSEDERSMVEDETPEDEMPEWQAKMMPKVREVMADEDGKRFLPLPDKFDIHEWSIMERFAREQDGRAERELLNAIHGRGAFRMFRSVLESLGLTRKWFDYREEALKDIAREWLEKHNLEYK